MLEKFRGINLDKWEKIPCSCGSFAVKGTLTYKKYSVRGWVCKKCGEKYIHPQDSMKISVFEKLKKKNFAIKVGTLGSSFVIRIPKEFAAIYSIEKGRQVILKPESLRNIQIKFD